MSKNNLDSANKYLQHAFVLGKKSRDPQLTGMSWYLKGKLHILLLENDFAMTAFIEADKIFKAAGLKKEHGLAEMQFRVSSMPSRISEQPGITLPVQMPFYGRRMIR